MRMTATLLAVIVATGCASRQSAPTMAVSRHAAPVNYEATVTTWWIRRGDYLTWINIVNNPSYLSEPLIRSSEYRLNVNAQVPSHPCTSVYEGLEKGHVPHFLLGENPFLKDIRARYGIPPDTPTGGAETMYPEFQRKLRNSAWTAGDQRALLDNDSAARPR